MTYREIPVPSYNPPPTAADPPLIVRVADGVFAIPGEPFPVALEDAEDAVACAFLGRPAMSLPELVDRSAVPHAAKVLARLVGKYPALDGTVIRRPKKRGRGGYGVRIRNDGPPLV
jgi:hypothetical protein